MPINIELIPVIEVSPIYEDIPAPSLHPYWEYPDVWEAYRRNCLSRSGFSHLLIPYLPGHPFFPVKSITENDLRVLLTDHTEGLRSGIYDRQDAAGIPGGYILRVNGRDIYFPQCCGELTDIDYWAGLADGNANSYYEGHPAPVVTIESDVLVFDFIVEKYKEPFQPPPPITVLKINTVALQKAVVVAKKELEQLSSLLNKINIEQNWEMDDITDILIWSNPNRI